MGAAASAIAVERCLIVLLNGHGLFPPLLQWPFARPRACARTPLMRFVRSGYPASNSTEHRCRRGSSRMMRCPTHLSAHPFSPNHCPPPHLSCPYPSYACSLMYKPRPISCSCRYAVPIFLLPCSQAARRCLTCVTFAERANPTQRWDPHPNCWHPC